MIYDVMCVCVFEPQTILQQRRTIVFEANSRGEKINLQKAPQEEDRESEWCGLCVCTQTSISDPKGGFARRRWGGGRVSVLLYNTKPNVWHKKQT